MELLLFCVIDSKLKYENNVAKIMTKLIIQNGLKQGDALSPLPSSSVLKLQFEGSKNITRDWKWMRHIRP
jgi:hypothetical protein